MNNGAEVSEFLERLAATEKAVIVEGKKDKSALEAIGVSTIFCIDKQPLYLVAEQVAASNKKVVILSDLDNEGKKIYSKLRTHLQFLGVEVDNYFREFLFRKTKLRQVEGMRALAAPNELS